MRDELLDPGVLRALGASGDYRILRRLDVCEGLTGVGGRTDTGIGVAVDCETTGVGDDDVIIELALRRFRFDPDGIIVKIDRSYSWLEDPGRPLPAEIVALTGMTDADVAGKTIDDEAICRLLNSADFVCAHNAAFDRGMVERREGKLQDARRNSTGSGSLDAFDQSLCDLAWACSCKDVDWRAVGFDGRSLGWLLAQAGFFHGAHRAVDDVDAVIALLQYSGPSGETVLSQMLTTARAPSWRFRAVGAHFDVKDLLRARGYRWEAGSDPKAWWRDVPDARKTEEEWWLAGHVYSLDARPKALAPIVERITWRERYAPPPRAIGGR